MTFESTVSSGSGPRHTRAGVRKYLTNAGALILERAAFAGINLVVGMFVARYLGPGDFGLFNVLISVVTILAAVAKLGLDGILVRELLVRAEDRRLDLSVAFWLMAASSVVFSFGLIAAMVMSGVSQDVVIYTALALSLVAVQPFTVIDMAFQADVRAGIPAASRVAVMLVGAALKVLAVVSGAPLLAFFVILAVEQVILILSYVLAARIFGVTGYVASFSTARARELLSSSWPMLVSAIAVSINIRITQILVAGLMDAKAAGVFAAASRIYEAWIYIPYVCLLAVTLALVNARQGNRDLYLRRLVIVTRIVLGLSLAVFVFFAAVGRPFIELTFGEAYAASYMPLSILMMSTIPAALGTVTAKYFVFEGRERAVASRTILAAALNIALCVLLIPLLGETGAALSVLGSLLAANYGWLWLRRADREILTATHDAAFPFVRKRRDA
ncbi:flippase [Silicimonas algicola]|uniref:O-antigen/teichoic acid export membrane protein n=1 Tax=Silicimonas algicola TaxID=1826607 RepID=A0A316GD17_9RHOB|nr:flippase [Silicimonas algicola]AZQ66503.1 flippase [Silicimonas algicola]PWK58841.1 O-antigen/teichoic acid export membrane protein [Silicimonas algicola]